MLYIFITAHRIDSIEYLSDFITMTLPKLANYEYKFTKYNVKL